MKCSRTGILLSYSLFLFFCNDFDIVKSLVSNSYWKTEIEDNVFALFQLSLIHI